MIKSCPSCKKGELIDSIIEDLPNGEHNETHYYSCGHKHLICEIPPVKLTVSAELARTKLTSGKKIRNKPVTEIDEQLKKNDRDKPRTNVIQVIYKHRNHESTAVFQVVEYEKGGLKHIHCKSCDNEWDYLSDLSLETCFLYCKSEKILIECKKCGSKFEK